MSTTTREKIAVMEARLRGERIECRSRPHTSSTWDRAFDPTWDWVAYDYRVVRVPRTLYINDYPNKRGSRVGFPTREEADMAAAPDRVGCIRFVEVLE